TDLAHLAWREQFGVARRELKGEAGELQCLFIERIGGEIHLYELLDPFAEAFALFDEAHSASAAGLYDSQQPVHVMFELCFQILPNLPVAPFNMPRITEAVNCGFLS